MLKRISILLGLLLCFSCTCMAEELDTPMSKELNITETVELEKIALKNNVATMLDQNLKIKTKLKNANEFKSIMNANAKAIYNNVSEYVRFIYQNELSNEELEIVNHILDNGTTIQTLTEVYDFWLTTDEDFAMVEEICLLEDRYFSEYWYENAFNKLTDHVHGELSAQQIMEYRDKGITTDQILAANVMCRKKGQNIFGILDNVLSGTSIEEQAKALYGVDEIVVEDTLFSAIDKIAKESRNKYKINTIKKLKLAINDEILDEVIQEKVNVAISNYKIQKPEEDAYEDYQALMKSGYPVSVQRALLNKGYTPQEIKKAAELGIWDIHKSAKNAREILKNEK